MKKSTLTIISIFIFSIVQAQSFTDFKLESNFDDFFSDFIEVNNSYIISGSQFDTDVNSFPSHYLRSFYAKISHNGNDTNIIFTDTFGSNNHIWATIFYNDKLYSFSSHIDTDSYYIRLNVLDTNFNLIKQRLFSSLSYKTISLRGNYKLNDSIVSFIANYTDSINNFHPLIIKFDLNNLCVTKKVEFNDVFYLNDYYEDTIQKRYYFTTTLFNFYFGGNSIAIYDSTFNLIDTVNLQYYQKGNTNILKYNDSLFLLSGHGTDIWNFDPNHPDPFYKLRLTVVDSNWKFISQKSFGVSDSTDVRAGYVQNLVKNSSNEYYIGGYLEEYYPDNLHPDLGVLIVKLDSNLNEIWQKHIPGNSRYQLGRIQPTDDGGVLMLIGKGAKNGNSADAFFIKIGPNGEVTGITDLKLPNRKAIVSIFPNPTSQNLNISLLAKKKNIEEIRIYDLQFKEILNRKINSTQTTIDVSKFAKGVYIVEGKTNTGEDFMEKFVVE